MDRESAPHELLYQALLDRDHRYAGRAYVCVTTTGVFCKLSCPARKPKAQHCIFYGSVASCLQAGFRPCKRCHPLQDWTPESPIITALQSAIKERPHFRWSERALSKMGYDVSTVRRIFKRHFGVTFLEMARQRRIGNGFDALAQGDNVITAQQAASFESASAFRRAFAALIGCSPSAFGKAGALHATWIETPLGDMVAVSSDWQLYLLEFVDRRALPTELRACE